jgi:hypothetical protein
VGFQNILLFLLKFEKSCYKFYNKNFLLKHDVRNLIIRLRASLTIEITFILNFCIKKSMLHLISINIDTRKIDQTKGLLLSNMSNEDYQYLSNTNNINQFSY